MSFLKNFILFLLLYRREETIRREAYFAFNGSNKVMQTLFSNFLYIGGGEIVGMRRNN